MIASFRDRQSARLFNGEFIKRLPTDILGPAQAKLLQLHEAITLEDLKVPPGNELEPLKGDRKGQYNIRINRQWRICFGWDGQNATQVEICDYH
ncbi:MAG: proteic killer suppression protein [Cyanobacteria bacterium RYN_339]|nr:proteic killer suppression protein [Cyanobacteria bacterium RYN_339]